MSFRPDLSAPKQDMPPPGGFRPIDIAAKTRMRGPSGATLWAVSSVAILFGMYRVGVSNRQKSGELLEQRKARYAMAPILQAEEDRNYVAREQEIMKKEQEIMKDVKDWKVGESVYLTKRWVPRHVAPLDKNLKK